MIVIGRKDKIDLPEFNLTGIEAKVDTGAYGCALHCHTVAVVERGGRNLLSFQLLDPSHPEYENKTYFTENFNEKKVKNSGGMVEDRYTIKTSIVIFGKKRMVDFSLTDRKSMKFPILLGRKFLKKKYLVNVALKNLSYSTK